MTTETTREKAIRVMAEERVRLINEAIPFGDRGYIQEGCVPDWVERECRILFDALLEHVGPVMGSECHRCTTDDEDALADSIRLWRLRHQLLDEQKAKK